MLHRYGHDTAGATSRFEEPSQVHGLLLPSSANLIMKGRPHSTALRGPVAPLRTLKPPFLRGCRVATKVCVCVYIYIYTHTQPKLCPKFAQQQGHVEYCGLER